MNYFERTRNQIGKLAKILSEAEGKKIISHDKLHKMMYIIQVKGEDLELDFSYNGNGMISGELRGVLEKAEKEGYVDIKKPSQGEVGEVSLRSYPLWINEIDIQDETKKIVKMLEGEDRLAVRGLASLIYYKKNYYKEKELKPKLQALHKEIPDKLANRAMTLYRKLKPFKS